MKKKTNIIIFLLAIILTLPAFAQDTLSHEKVLPTGIFVSYGQGWYAVKDQYISKEQYSGMMPYYNLEWLRFRNKKGYRLQFEYRKSTDISNHNITTDAQQVSFSQDFIFAAGDFPVGSKNVYAFLGPSVQIFYYELYYNFAQPGNYITPTTLGFLGSLGINANLIYPLNKKLNLEGFLRSNVLSITGKKIDDERYRDDQTPAFVSVISASKIDFHLSVRYFLAKNVALSVAYKFDLSRINKWDPYIAASNSALITVQVKL